MHPSFIRIGLLLYEMNNIFVKSGGYIHIIDLAGLHVAPVLICNVVFAFDLSFRVCSNLFTIRGRKIHKDRSCALNNNTFVSLK